MPWMRSDEAGPDREAQGQEGRRRRVGEERGRRRTVAPGCRGSCHGGGCQGGGWSCGRVVSPGHAIPGRAGGRGVRSGFERSGVSGDQSRRAVPTRHAECGSATRSSCHRGVGTGLMVFERPAHCRDRDKRQKQHGDLAGDDAASLRPNGVPGRQPGRAAMRGGPDDVSRSGGWAWQPRSL